MFKKKDSSLLVFDFDGTIADTLEHSIQILNDLSAEFGFKRIEDGELEYLRGRTLWQFVRHLRIPIRKITKILRRAQAEMSNGIMEIQVFPGMAEVLRELKGRGYVIGLMTSNSIDNVTKLLDLYDLDIFDFKMCSVKLRKKAGRLRRLRRAHRVRKQNVLYIGDECRDIRAAHKARVKSAAVSWGFNDKQILRSFNPNYLLSEPSDLLEVCGEFRAAHV
jgi:phosphoglycolate phosphatase